jgi:hypothetical protein
MNFIQRFKYTNHLVRLLEVILPVSRWRNQSIKIEDKYNIFNGLSEKVFSEIVILASGPSSKKVKFRPDALYITTNASYMMLPKDYSFIHLINDLGYLKKFIAFGLNAKPLVVVVDAPYSAPKHNGFNLLKQLQHYGIPKGFEVSFLTQQINYPDSNNIELSNSIERFYNQHSSKNPCNNSGLRILKLGLWLGNKLNIPVSLFGLDAGEGGQVYFDGRKTLPNHVAMRDKNKEEIGEYLDFINTNFNYFTNHSFYKPTNRP